MTILLVIATEMDRKIATKRVFNQVPISSDEWAGYVKTPLVFQLPLAHNTVAWI